jgi:hypothetical protein
MVRAGTLVLACCTLALASPAAARADELFAESGSLVMTQEAQVCCQAQSWSFATPADTFKVWSYQFDPGNVILFVTPPSGDFWRFEIAAPRGELLEAKTYLGATRTSFRAPGEPGIDIRSVSGWCGDTVGDFTVHDVEYGPYNVVTRFHANFTQYCGSEASPALRGELDIVVPPVTRGPYQLDLEIDATGTRHAGKAILQGTIGCNAETPVEIQGFLRQFQVGRYDEVGAVFVINMVCTGPSTPFTAVVPADGYQGRSTVPIGFQRGNVLVEATVRAEDGIYAFPAEAAQSLTVALD